MAFSFMRVYCPICRQEMDGMKPYGSKSNCCGKKCNDEWMWRETLAILGKPPRPQETIQEAAARLDKELRPHPWYQAVGIDSPFDTKMIVYIVFKPGKGLPGQTYDGWPVEVKEVGPVEIANTDS